MLHVDLLLSPQAEQYNDDKWTELINTAPQKGDTKYDDFVTFMKSTN